MGSRSRPVAGALAAEAAIDLVWLDHAALRYCEPLGQCLVDKNVSGKKLHFAMQRAAENAERGIKRLSAKGTLDDEASCRQALGVAAVTRSEALKDVLTETVILAEKMRAPPKQKKGDSSSSDSDFDGVIPGNLFETELTRAPKKKIHEKYIKIRSLKKIRSLPLKMASQIKKYE